MRQSIIRQGSNELSYEIRDIVKKGDQLKSLGYKIYWENIGDPIQKNGKVPEWIKEIIISCLKEDETYGYSHSKGLLKTRQFLAERTNAHGGVQITAEDICFFNGLGDAIGKIYHYLLPTARVIGPSPAYSTHSSLEAAHANANHITYRLNPDDNWCPDLDDLYMKVKYNEGIVGILVINPDNPTGAVYPKQILVRIIDIAREFGLFVIFDEIYQNITYNDAFKVCLAEVIGDVPGISMKGISKEFPWPGARCGWLEYYNRTEDEEFNRFCQTLDNAKMMEVSATTLPQRVIPKVMNDPRYMESLNETNAKISERSNELANYFNDIPYVWFNRTQGAFYNTVIFKPEVLKPSQYLSIGDDNVMELLNSWKTPDMSLDKLFVYNLMAAKQVVVVPISTFNSDLQGFRMTLLEEDDTTREMILNRIRDGIMEFCGSD